MNARTPRCYLTLRCNMSCPYCSNGHDLAKYDEIAAEDWAEIINNVGTGDVVFTGGEPTLYPHFYALLHLLSGTHFVNVYTNLKNPLSLQSLPRMIRGIRFRASCHAQTVKEAVQWVEHATELHEAGYPIHMTTVHCPPKVLEVLLPRGIEVNEPQYAPAPLPPPVECTLPRTLIAPDGQRYHCVGKLVSADPFGRVGLHDPAVAVCHTPDVCAACDSISAKRRTV